MKLQRIDKEMMCLKTSDIHIRDKATGELVDLTYAVHDTHIYSSFEHVLCMIREAELLAHEIVGHDLCKSQLIEVGKRRAAFMLVMMKVIKTEVGTKL